MFPNIRVRRFCLPSSYPRTLALTGGAFPSAELSIPTETTTYFRKIKLRWFFHTPQTRSPVWTSDGLSTAAPSPVCVLRLNWLAPFHRSCAWLFPPLPGTKALWPPLLNSLCSSKRPEPRPTLLLRIYRLKRWLKQKKMTPRLRYLMGHDWF